MYVLATISRTSMVRNSRVSIGLFDYSQPVMGARAIALSNTRRAFDLGVLLTRVQGGSSMVF